MNMPEWLAWASLAAGIVSLLVNFVQYLSYAKKRAGFCGYLSAWHDQLDSMRWKALDYCDSDAQRTPEDSLARGKEIVSGFYKDTERLKQNMARGADALKLPIPLHYPYGSRGTTQASENPT